MDDFGERNHRTFENEEKLIQDIKIIFLRILFEYCTSLREGVGGWVVLDAL